METVNRKDKLHTIAVAIMLAVAFLFLFLLGGYGGAGDSESYLTMGITREPLYPMFLWVLRQIFGNDAFYKQLAFIQNAFATVSSILLMYYLGKKVYRSNLGKWLSAFILLMPFLLTPIFSRTHLVMANKVMAEGVTLPGYYIFIYFVIRLIFEHDNMIRNVIGASVSSALLVLLRGQLLLTIIILAIVLFIILVRDRKFSKLYIPFILAAGIFLLTSLITDFYHYCNSDKFTGTASSKPMILANALYVSEESDGNTISNPDLKLLFNRTYKELNNDKMLEMYATGGIISHALYHESCHDSISFDYFEPIKNDIYVDRMGNNYSEYMIFQDEIASSLTKELLKNNWGRYLKNYISVCALGFVRSIAVQKKVLDIYVIFAYLSGLLLILYTWRIKGFTQYSFFFLMTYIMIIGFVMSTSLILQCITRYMIYNLPFFYLAGISVFFDIIKKRDREITNC